MKLGKLAGFLGAFLFGAIFLVSLRSTFESADWTQKPDEAALRRASATLTLPPDAVGEPLDVFSKGTFIGASRNVVTRLAMEDAEHHFADVAARNGWTLTSRRERRAELRLADCAGNVSQIISLRGRAGGTAIFAATYWDSDRSTDLYCRL